MADKLVVVKYSAVTVTIPETQVPPEEAGMLSAVEQSRIPRAPRSVAAICDTAADAIDRAGKAFQCPPGVTADLLRKSSRKSVGSHGIVRDLEVIMSRFRQSNLLTDAEAYKLIRQVKDQVKAQSKHCPELAKIFAQFLEAFSVERTRKEEPAPSPAPTPAPIP